MRIVVVFAVLLTFFMSGCGSKEGVRSSAQKSYLYFTGDVKGALVSIDKGQSFSVKSGQENQYTLKPGKHIIEMFIDGNIVMQREIYLGDGIAKEIEIR